MDHKVRDKLNIQEDLHLNSKLDEIEAKLIEQEHRTAHVALNAYKYYSENKDNPKKKAAMRALFWRVFTPYTAAAIVAGGGIWIGAWHAILLTEQNVKLGQQTEWLEKQTTLLDRQNHIAANEGRWELLWKLHFDKSQDERLAAFNQLVGDKVSISGIELIATLNRIPESMFAVSEYPGYLRSLGRPQFQLDVPLDVKNSIFIGFDLFHGLHPQFDGKGNTYEGSVVRLPDRISNTTFRNSILATMDPYNYWVGFLDRKAETHISNSKIEDSLVFLNPVGKGMIISDSDASILALVDYDGDIEYSSNTQNELKDSNVRRLFIDSVASIKLSNNTIDYLHVSVKAMKRLSSTEYLDKLFPVGPPAVLKAIEIVNSKNDKSISLKKLQKEAASWLENTPSRRVKKELTARRTLLFPLE